MNSRVDTVYYNGGGGKLGQIGNKIWQGNCMSKSHEYRNTFQIT